MNSKLWLVWSNEHKQWWSPARCGYTNLRSEAGRYSLEEAIDIVERSNCHLQDQDAPDEALVPEDNDFLGRIS